MPAWGRTRPSCFGVRVNFLRRIKEHSLYLVITEEYGNGRSALEIARAAIAGGVDIIQMREKAKPKDELILIGKDLARICKANNVIFIVNDDPLLAAEVDADGVHLGQEDAIKYPIEDARKILGINKIIGISTHSREQFYRADKEGYDYIAFGPIFPTKTKDYSLGTKDVAKVAANSKGKVFFIGGINLSNIGEILKNGAKNIAMIRAITEAENIEAQTRKYKAVIQYGYKN